MGEVWLAEDPRLHRQVAIKTLPAHNQDDHEYSRRFEREAQAAAALNHPHILPVHSYGEQPRSDGQIVMYIVMPYISGGSLAERITAYTSRQMMMPPQEAITYLSQAAEAIDYAHSRGVIHRDIKPGNMLLRSDNWLLLADFGIARMVAQGEQLTKTGVGFGTPEYMAPEQAQGKAEAASDLYSLAVLAYLLFTGRLPFSADSGYAITIQHITMDPPPPSQFNPALSPAVAQALLQGLAKDPIRRHPSARAFVASLQSALASAPFETTYLPDQLARAVIEESGTPDGKAPVTSPGQVDRTILTPATEKRHILTRRQVLIGGGAALAVAGGGLGILELSSRSRPSPHRSGGTTPGTQRTASTAGAHEPAMTLLGHNSAVQVLAWSPRANILASSGSANDNQVFLWDIDSAYQQKNPTPKYTSAASFDLIPNGFLVAWSPDGTALAIANTRAGNIANNPYVLLVYKGDLSGPTPGYEKPLILFSNVIEACNWLDTTYIVTVTYPTLLGSTMELELWDWRHPERRLTQATIARTLGPAPSPLTVPSQALSVSPHGSLVALIALDDAGQESLLIGQLVVSGKRARWQQRLPAILYRRSNSPIPFSIGGIAWFPSGHAIAAFTNDADPEHTLATWNMQHTQADPVTFAGPPALTLTTIAVSPVPSPSLLAVGTGTGTIFLLNLDHQGSIERTFQGSHAEITALAWSKDGKWLAAGFNDTNASILVWKM
jgi:serine/threonine protein kinase